MSTTTDNWQDVEATAKRVLGEKIKSSGPVRDYVEVVGSISGKLKRFTFG